MDKPINPRLGLTSASNALADYMCPGRHLAQRGLEGSTSRDAEAGQLIHSAFAGEIDPETLIPAHRKTVLRGKEIESHMVERWYQIVKDPLPQDDDAEAINALIEKRAKREVRLWAYRNGQKIHSGAVDAMWFANDMGDVLIEDLKSLFGDVDDAPENLQLRDYAALVALNYGARRVTVFINQPNVRWKYEDQEYVTYAGDDLVEAVLQMERRVMDSNSLMAARIPSSTACRFCAACATDRCPESLETIMKYVASHDAGWKHWTPEERGNFIKGSKLAEKIAGQALDVAREAIKLEPDWATGWEVTKDATVRKLADGSLPEIAAILPNEYALEDLQKAATITLGDLEVIHKRFSEQDSDVERREEFKILFGHLITESTRRGSLKAVK